MDPSDNRDVELEERVQQNGRASNKAPRPVRGRSLERIEGAVIPGIPTNARGKPAVDNTE